ncbi:MAG: alpha-L-rhamnosidase N-terminal domain-containing protein [Armatimonadetes bacterium]|nr:alpha-L-rhamnosidase N-terminal domain-containing protein [Armatimonadota bacterium]
MKSHKDTPNFYLYVRKELDLDNAPEATAYVTCRCEYKLYVNGRYVGRGPGLCGTVQYYDQYELKRYMRPGRNVIGALCHNPGVDTVIRPMAPGGFLFQMEVGSGEEKLIIASNETWKVKPAEDYDFNSERISPSLGFQEIYDSRGKPVGWNVVGFDDSGWDEPEVIGEAGAGLVRRPILPLRMREVFPGQGAGTVPAGADSTVTLDFGREVIGFPTIRVRDGGNGVIDISYSEELGDASVSQADRVILHGGRQEWQSFGRRVFRHARLTFIGLDRPVHVEGVSLGEVGYPVAQGWSFECSDDVLNKVFRTGIYTLGLSMQDTYEASPLTDPSQHAWQARTQALLNYYAFSDTDLAAKALRELAPGLGDRACPDDALLWAIMLHDYYLYTGDRYVVEELYESMRVAIEEHLRAREGDDGLPRCRGSACPICGAFYYQALRDASKLAAALSNHNDSVLWHSRAEAVFHVYNSTFWSDSAGKYQSGECSELINMRATALAVAFGLANAGQCDRVRELVASRHELITGADLGWSLYALQAMSRLGMASEALEMIRSIWGGMLSHGATTWWDTYDAGTACPSSRCCAASGAPTWFLAAEVLGVKPSTPQSPVVIIQPRTGGLEWAKGGFSTHPGFLEVEWRRTKNAFQIDINAPDGFIVALPVAGFAVPVVEERDLNPETPERRARKTYGWGNVIWRDGEERDPYVDWLKSQEEELPENYEARERCRMEEGYIWVRESVTTHVRYIVRDG